MHRMHLFLLQVHVAHHDLDDWLAVLVPTPAYVLERLDCLLQGVCLRHHPSDVAKFARCEQSERFWVCVGISEHADEVNLANETSGDGQKEIRSPHTNVQHFSTGDRSLR